MIAPETLLKLEPLEALRLQMQEVLRKPLKASHLVISKPISLGGLRTQVNASLDKTKAPLDLWDRVGEVAFEYDRLDLSDFVSTLNRTVKSTFPVSSKSLLTAMLKPYGVPVVDGDMLPVEYLAPTSLTLLSSDDSYRWRGECDCIIEQLGLEIMGLVKHTSFSPSFNAQFYSSRIKEILTFFINVNNAKYLTTPLTTSMFVLETPVVNGPISDRDNTRIDLTLTGLPYTGTLSITYMRRGFDSTFRYPVKLSGGQLSNKRQLANALSVQMGCTIAASDLSAAVFPSLGIGQKQLISVSLEHTSLAYVGDILVEYTRTT